MKIDRIDVHRINLPLKGGYLWSSGLNCGYTKGIVVVKVDQGIEGYGQVDTLEEARIVENDFAPLLRNADPLNVEDCSRRCLPEFRTQKNIDDQTILRAFGGLEMALCDIRAKVLEVPLYRLFGGPVRKEITFTEYFAIRPASPNDPGTPTCGDVAKYCATMREKFGSTIFEGKMGTLDLKSEINMIKEVRAAIGPDAILRLDANMAWPLNTAREALKKLEAFDIANMEDPVASYFDMVKLRTHSAIPFSSHGPTDLRLITSLGVPDAMVLNVANLGGIRETIKFINACETMGVGFWFYSGDSAVGTAAYMQLGAALPFLEQPNQSLFRWYDDDIIEEPFCPRDNKLPVPEGHGLGIKIDRKALKRCKERFQKQGPLESVSKRDSIHYRRLRMQ